MMSSRTNKSIKNASYSFIIQILLIIINFISRTIFIKILGSDYLGINGLYTNILTVLSLAELGFGNAIIYSMYKPLAESDNKKIAALLNFYKKIYNIIILVILVAGLLLIPFLQYFINSNLDINSLRIYYVLFLFNTLASYIYAYKISILQADQNMYIIKIYHFWTVLIQFVLQTIFLLIYKNYIIYLVIQILCTLLNNISLNIKINKTYSYLNKQNEQITKKEKKEIYSNVRATFIQKISGTIVNNTDNILISIMVGTIWVGYYSNYFLIISAITSILTILFNSISASVGNLTTEGNIKKQSNIFSNMVFIAFWICGVCSICAFNLFNDFIYLWVGKEYVLNEAVVLIIVINFYIMGMLNPIWTFRDATGLFKDTKFASLALAISNIVLSIILGKYFKLFGILIATAISRLITTYWYTPYMLYKKKFNTSSSKYFLKQVVYMLCLIIAYIIIMPINKYLVANNYIMFFIKAAVEFILINVIFLIIFHKTEDYKDIYVRFIKNKLYDKIKLKQK